MLIAETFLVCAIMSGFADPVTYDTDDHAS